MIIGYSGDPGSGKTLGAVRELIKSYKEGLETGIKYNIYSNIHLSKVKYTLYTTKELVSWSKSDLQFDNALFLLDEAHIYIDSRTSVSKRNRIISYLLLQTRKKHIHMYWTTQYSHQVDKRLRDVTDIEIQCHHKRETDLFMQVILYKGVRGIRVRKLLYKGTPWYEYYNTDEVVKMPDDNP